MGGKAQKMGKWGKILPNICLVIWSLIYIYWSFILSFFPFFFFFKVATDVFNSKNLAVQAQKKILGKMVSKSIATTLIDDTSSEVLDELYRVTKEYTQNKKEAEKIIKNLIKTVIKLAILYRNNQFNQDELALMEKFKKKVHQLAMTVVSFHQVDYTFDRNVLSRLLNECRELLHQIIQRHLTAKSHGRVNNVFDHFSNCEFLAALYNPFGNFKPHLQKLCDGINKMLDEENIWVCELRLWLIVIYLKLEHCWFMKEQKNFFKRLYVFQKDFAQLNYQNLMVVLSWGFIWRKYCQKFWLKAC